MSRLLSRGGRQGNFSCARIYNKFYSCIHVTKNTPKLNQLVLQSTSKLYSAATIKPKNVFDSEALWCILRQHAPYIAWWSTHRLFVFLRRQTKVDGLNVLLEAIVEQNRVGA